MSINHLTNQSVYSIGKLDFKKKLKPGQIIQGKILELFPNQKAKIQLGTKEMIAQIEAPLVSGEKYYFKVENMDTFLHLKLLGLAGGEQKNEGVIELLRKLNLPLTTELQQFAQHLLSEKISFQPQELKAAYAFLQQIENKELGKQIVKNMLLMDYPITSSIFESLIAREITDVSTISNTVLKQIQSQEIASFLETKLMTQLQTLMERNTSTDILLRGILSEIQNKNNRLFHLFKIAGTIDLDIDYSEWTTKWKQYFKQETMNPTTTHYNQWNHTNVPFQIKENSFFPVLEQMVKDKKEIQDFVKEISQNRTVLLKANQNDIQKIIDIIPTPLKNHFLTMFSSLRNRDDLFHTLEILQEEKTYHYMSYVNNLYKKSHQFLSLPIKNQFLLHVEESIHVLGLNHEHLLTNMQPNKDSMKAILLQLMQEHHGTSKQIYQQFIHLINGLQVQSVQESQHMLHAFLQMPGGRFGLTEPIELHFAGKKRSNGTLDSDYCRIVFDLYLTHLHQTVIDMYVQKRTVTLTVYNDHLSSLKQKTAPLEPVLKKGLEKLNYQLISIAYKPLEKKEQSTTFFEKENKTYSYEGIDCRI